ncbi:MAG: FGGY-family carbohydrate kinase, partial [Rhodanobacter sp.]|nr:FGGY-family carbohydrate kinase [Rhodanobacter sp.]
MSEKSYLLAIDSGTQSVRALLFDLHGTLVGKGRVELQPYYADQPGWAEQDPDYYWANLGEACQRLWQAVDIDRRQIRGVSLTTQRGTVVNVDAQGRALRPAMLWLDQRRAKVEGRIKGPWGWLFKLIGEEATVDHFRAQAEVNWIVQQQPQIWAKTHKLLLLSGFLTHRLCDRFVDSVACCVAYLPFDYKRLTWAAPGDWKWQAVQVRADQLPQLVKPGEQLGVITAEASRHTGIPEGLPLIAAGADKACEVLGAGGVDPQTACLSYGTTATINTTRRSYLETVPLLPPYPAAIPDHFNTEVMIYRGFWMVSWFKQEFGLSERLRADALGVEPETLFDELVRAVPPGSMGLMLQPYWSPGIREPGLEAKGAIIGFGDVHTRAHVYRAILEGLAYALRQGKEKIEKRSGTAITRLRVSGGGSQSDAAMQLTADIFGLP